MADNTGANPSPPAPSDHPGKAKQIVFNHTVKDHRDLSIHEVYIVWFCFILGGWKALVSTTIHDGKYYEVTYNSRKEEVYLDVYRKTDNILL